MHAMKNYWETFTKRDLWVIMITLIVGFGLGTLFISWRVPDASHWIQAYKDQATETKRLKDANDGVIPLEEMPMNHTTEGNPYMMRKVVSEKQFVQDMVLHHQAAVTMATQVLALPNIRPEIKDLAQNIISAQTTEIKMMQDWITAWK